MFMKSIRIVFLICSATLMFCFHAGADEIKRLEGRIDAISRMYENEIRELREEIAEIKGERPVTQTEEPKVTVSWDRHLSVWSADGRNALTLYGRIQPRYEYERRTDPGLSDNSSFFLRRTRLDFRGHIYSKDLTFRIMPELGRQANLRDAWVDYRFNDMAGLRGGQYNIPFAWERDSSSNRHQFLERSTANNEFQWADGRDIGVMLHGNLAERVRYGIGMFGGEGRNVRRTSTTGNLWTGRITYAALGKYPREEALVKPVDDVNLSFGTGLGYANKNAARDWHPWSGSIEEFADVSAAAADVHYQSGLFSTHLSGFYRRVDPLRQTLNAYYGWGFNTQAGILLKPERIFAAIRYSQARPDHERDRERQEEGLLALHYFIRGHDSKVVAEAGRTRKNNGSKWYDTDLVRIQYQLLF